MQIDCIIMQFLQDCQAGKRKMFNALMRVNIQFSALLASRLFPPPRRTALFSCAFSRGPLYWEKTTKVRTIMPNFDPLTYRYSSRRNVVYAKNGVCCTSVPLGAQVGLDVLKNGGNAVDAAVAMAGAMPLLEPTGNGLGSDCFALVWIEKEKKLYGLNASGVAPMALSADEVRAKGFSEVPEEGLAPHDGPGRAPRAGRRSMRALAQSRSPSSSPPPFPTPKTAMPCPSMSASSGRATASASPGSWRRTPPPMNTGGRAL